MHTLIYVAFKDKETERAWFRERYAKNIQVVQQLKLDRGCTDCAYNTHSAALEFDHIFFHSYVERLRHR